MDLEKAIDNLIDRTLEGDEKAYATLREVVALLIDFLGVKVRDDNRAL